MHPLENVKKEEFNGLMAGGLMKGTWVESYISKIIQ